MRRVIMWNMVTLEGCFEGSRSWDIDFHDYVWGPELQQFSMQQSQSIATLLFGRITYEGMANYWPSAKGETAAFMNNVPKVVFSRTLKKAEWNNTRLVRGSAEDEVIRLKQEPGEAGKDIFILGSADLSSSLIQRGLIDEYRLGLTPIVLGNGHPLFKAGTGMRMRLLEAKPLTSGCVILRYKPEMQLRWAAAEPIESMEHVG